MDKQVAQQLNSEKEKDLKNIRIFTYVKLEISYTYVYVSLSASLRGSTFISHYIFMGPSYIVRIISETGRNSPEQNTITVKIDNQNNLQSYPGMSVE